MLVSPRASGVCYCQHLWLTQAIILLSFGIPRMDAFCLGSFHPRHVRHPSAVRFTPAVKYGGRENWPSCRETRCMSGHPCRAHHKLKWARKMQSVLKLLYKHVSRSESSITISTQSSAVSQAPTGQLCLTGVGNNPLTIKQPRQRAVSRMPQARRKPGQKHLRNHSNWPHECATHLGSKLFIGVSK